MKTKVLKNIPANALKILAKLSDDEYSAYVVGGAVRDSILERKVHDIDIATSATPNEVINVFKDYKVIPVGIKHGTVAVAIKGEQFEITTLRIDGKYTDNRSPETIEFTRNIKDDVKRRDFTINSLAFNLQEGVIDYEDGLKDIKNKVIRAVGNPNKRFEEDSLRILRALRFASHLGFEIEKETQKAIVDKKDLLKNISSERINKELTGILAGKNVKKILIENKEVIATFIPEIEEMFNYDQNNPYHNKNLWGHTIKTIESVNDSKEMKVAALLHDIGKPKTMTINKKGYSNYLGHSEKSTEIATVILKRLKYTNKETKEILDIIKNHSKNISINPYKIKRDIYTMGTKSFFNMLDFKEADNKGKKSDNLGVIKENDKIRYIRKFAKEYLDGNPILSHTDLEITPRHLIDIGLKGKDIGDTLDKLVLLALNGQPNELKRQLKYVETRIVNNLKIIDRGDYMTKSEFINKATRGPVSIGNGQYYIAKKINTDNFKIYSEDERLLYESRKYNQTYIGFVTRNKSKVHKLTKTKAYDRNGNLVIERLNNSLIETIKVDLANLELDLLSRASKVNY